MKIGKVHVRGPPSMFKPWSDWTMLVKLKKETRTHTLPKCVNMFITFNFQKKKNNNNNDLFQTS